MRVLVVDDDPHNVKMVAFLLKEEGYTVVSANSGQTALEIIEREPPDLVILDVMMPHLDGLEVTRRVRQHHQIPIIILSAKGEVGDRVAGLQLGADDYLAKPFEPAELVARVRAVLRRAEPHVVGDAQSRLTVGDLTIDSVEHKVIRPDGKVVILTPIEFKLLHCLMRNAGRVLTPDVLLSTVWGYDYDGESNQIAVYMGRLRNKIEKNPSRPRYLITVRGLGYKFVQPNKTER